MLYIWKSYEKKTHSKNTHTYTHIVSSLFISLSLSLRNGHEEIGTDEKEVSRREREGSGRDHTESLKNIYT